MDVVDVWKLIVAKYMCAKYSCEDCHKIFGNECCNKNEYLSDDEVMGFIVKVTEELNKLDAPFETTADIRGFLYRVPADEVARILKECSKENAHEHYECHR